MSTYLNKDGSLDWKMIGLTSVVVIGIAACWGLAIYTNFLGRAERATYLEICMKDHKEYECDYMWRAGR